MNNYRAMTDAEIQREIEMRKNWYPEHKGTPPIWVKWIAAAWELVDEMRSFDEIEVYLYCDSGENGNAVHVYRANWNGGDDVALSELADGMGSTMPRAICEAWLQWKDAQK